MTPSDLKERCGALFGHSKWRAHLARVVGCSHKTARRWAAGKSAIPGHVEFILELLEALDWKEWPDRAMTKRMLREREHHKVMVARGRASDLPDRIIPRLM